jgi:AbrB family looped-hinge helix DNA binding protein
MPTATVTSKGQITIPVEVREDMGLGPGSRVDFVAVGDGEYRVMVKSRSVSELAGMFRSSGPPVSTADMNEAIADAVVERYLRSR